MIPNVPPIINAPTIPTLVIQGIDTHIALIEIITIVQAHGVLTIIDQEPLDQ
jgi:hypothetical protein